MIIPFKTIPDIRPVFDGVPDDKRLAKLFSYNETLDLCRIVGATHRRGIKEHLHIGAIREHLEAGEIVVPTCNCGMGEGRRWHAADEGREVTYAIHGSVNVLPFDAIAYTHESMGFVSALGERLKLTPVSSGVPDIIVEAAPYDGPGRTLGVTLFFERPNDDLFVGHRRFPSVRIIIDTNENWNVDYFRTVMRHEVVHAVGIDHAPDFMDLLWAAYTGVKLGHPGMWTQGQVDQRYTEIARAA